MSEITNFQGKATVSAPGTEADRAVAALMTRVGQRVRKAREMKGLPRRVISESSGVSMRYLAQLETGEGNISIALLKRVALALDIRMEWLLDEEDPWTSDVVRFSELFRSSTAQDRRRAIEALNPERPESQRASRVCLVGLRGAGKSTLGALAGEALDVPFLELNRNIEEHAGMPVTELMAFYGQEGYRTLEAQAVDRVIATHSTVILAVAGGIVAEPSTFNTVLSHFHVIWVKASPQEHMDRVQAQGDLRPMAGNPEAMTQLRTILRSREALYRQAHAEFDTSRKDVQAAARDLADLIRARGFISDCES
ncbi:helix-turn-helix transcriptional regulator [Aquicoccus sp. G2-2]|jgi:XRE family aerobic/anaerobic benzoate catabolism transcriptional regulator|uniref:helix-turn-helix transcriptional regulator n=1 Tax=Aquicoccus sp. G2-2 TaxID=3092120 RepID=UPI002AE043F5|nr:helix-turn-helix transcriptional regulator [Aquicoccus sp. G2-2]MEA1114352.1 helix-turn-helix transcriptional regulator [Aquicoccus sp. G2-2]